MSRFDLTEVQARAILDLRLQRLTQLEVGKIEEEHARAAWRQIAELRAILGDEARVYAVIREELLDIKERFGDDRRTEIIAGEGEIDIEDLIADEEMVISITSQRLHQAPAGHDLPRAAARRQGPARRARSRRRTTSTTCSSPRRTTGCCSSPTRAASTARRSTSCRRRARDCPRAAHRERPGAASRTRRCAQVFNTRDYGEGKLPGARDPGGHGQEDRVQEPTTRSCKRGRHHRDPPQRRRRADRRAR